jgi:ribosomal protein L40E
LFRKIIPILAFFLLFSILPAAMAQTSYSIEVGAFGDDASRGNMGVSVEIRTHVPSLASEDQSYSFWVGSNLQIGAFVQFGYEVVPSGLYCMYGQVNEDHTNCQGSYGTIGENDAVWFWEYWPNAKVNSFYYGLGASNSSGPEGAWHLYQILPDAANGWSFLLDGQPVSSIDSVQWAKSKDPVYAVAEEVSGTSSTSGNLGPVEFRNLSYYSRDSWHMVTKLSAISGCGGLTPKCGIPIPYGITMLGANNFFAGIGEKVRKDGELLWTQGEVLPNRSYLLTLIVPSGAQVTIDGTNYSEDVSLSLPAGPHWIKVPDSIQMNKTRRLRFLGWSDGSTDLNRMIDLSSNRSLQASFTQQYTLGINSPFPASGEGWFSEGTTGTFTTDASPRLTNTLGITIFRGWYDETGNLVTNAGTGSIVMNRSHSLEARWVRLEYAIPLTLLALFGSVVVIGIRRRHNHTSAPNMVTKESENNPSELRHTIWYSPPQRESRQLPLSVCRYCGGRLTPNGKRCSECGISTNLGYMGG